MKITQGRTGGVDRSDDGEGVNGTHEEGAREESDVLLLQLAPSEGVKQVSHRVTCLFYGHHFGGAV